MSGNSLNLDSRKWCGIKGRLRLNSRRFSVQRLRVNFLFIFRVFRRWKNSYRNCLRRLRRRRGKNIQTVDDVACGFSTSSYAVRRMTHSNSFCSEAIADCLEFIKRNSVSVDDERKPMLKQE